MKVILLEDIGLHNAGTILDMQHEYVSDLERSGKVKMVIDGEPLPEIKKKVDPVVDESEDEEVDATDVSLEINTAPLEANRKIVEREVKRGRKAKK